MQIQLLSLLEILLLTTALSVDAFATSLAYGAGNIHIHRRSVATISLVCSGMLMASLWAGHLIGPLIPAALTRAICFLLLFLPGIAGLFTSTIKTFIGKMGGGRREIRFKVCDLRFILMVYANPEAADRDASRDLSPAEAVSLAVALSLDGLAVGFGAGVGQMSPCLVLLLSLFTTTAALLTGFRMGNRLADRLDMDLGWLSGLMLIALSLLKL